MSFLNSLFPTTSTEATVNDGTHSSTTATAPTPTVRPAYNVKEGDDAFTVTVRLPGVAKDGLDISAENGELTITGKRTWSAPDAWTPVYRESNDVSYQLTLRHESVINIDQAKAELRDGILTLTLPKNETVKPRKIAIA